MAQTGFPGHNKGKVWVPGVGYRYPKRPKKPIPTCDTCSATAHIFSYGGGKLCLKHFDLLDEE